MFLFGFCFAVPFATIVFCYSQLLITLKLVRKTAQNTIRCSLNYFAINVTGSFKI